MPFFEDEDSFKIKRAVEVLQEAEEIKQDREFLARVKDEAKKQSRALDKAIKEMPRTRRRREPDLRVEILDPIAELGIEDRSESPRRRESSRKRKSKTTRRGVAASKTKDGDTRRIEDFLTRINRDRRKNERKIDEAPSTRRKKRKKAAKRKKVTKSRVRTKMS